MSNPDRPNIFTVALWAAIAVMSLFWVGGFIYFLVWLASND